MSGQAARVALAAALAVTTAGIAACEEDSKTSSSLDRVTAAWRDAGLEVPPLGPFAGAGIGGGKCSAGIIQKIETVVCTYPNADAAKSARAAGLGYVGDATGVALAAGDTLLVIVDRAKADPSGKTINAISVAFAKALAPSPPKAESDEPDEPADPAKTKTKAEPAKSDGAKSGK